MKTHKPVALLLTIVLFTSLAFAQATAPAPETYPVQVQAGVRVKMRDGVSLVCDIYRPKAEKPGTFDYDPISPVRTIGGRLCCGGLPPGPFDQSPNESRTDVLVSSTPVLEQDVEVTGFITAELYASTSAADTDFTVMIVDVDEKGYARYLGDGIIRARYRNSTAKAEPIEPN